MTSEESYVATRRQLHGIAESLVAGPQHRATGTIRLAVSPDGFVGTAVALGVSGGDYTWPGGAARLAGPPRALAGLAGVDFGPPRGVYDVADPLDPDADLDLDPHAAELLYRSLHAGGFALVRALPESHPVLWPEHLDVAVTVSEVNYGVSAGDDYHGTPYAYVGPWTRRTGAFWNAPFGAVRPMPLDHDANRLAADAAAFFDEGRRLLADGPEPA